MTEQQNDKTTDQTEEKAEQQAQDPHRASYSAATKRLRDEFRDRFNELMAQEMKNRGQQWSPRPTEEQKAEKEIADLLEKYPELKVKFSEK